ncbi:MAG: hypothetical protein RO257_13270 [Candidatus Kapabacteria bacterium]|nr:hypothetical protein [Candidatus Kapabacteria bacterium]
MLRILICLCFINIVLFQSCRSGYTAIEENEEKTIKLSTPTKEVYSNNVIIKLIKVDDLEVHIPLIFISKYVEFRNENILRLYINYLKDFLSSFNKGVFDGTFYIGNEYDDMDGYKYLMSNDIKFFIKDSKFFESGDYFVYNTKTN